MNPLNISQQGRNLLNRRSFLGQAGGALGSLGLLSLLSQDKLLATEKTPFRPAINAQNPYAPRNGHFKGKAKQVLVIYCPGAVSQVDTFDYKPELVKFHGQKPPGIPAVTFEGPTGNIAKPFWDFKPRGKSGKMTSDLLPNLGELSDDFSFIHSMTTSTSAHPQGENFFNTGSTFEGYPSRGSWIGYALGTENQDLPAFVSITDPRGNPRSGKNNFGSGFLPAAYQGTSFNASQLPANLKIPNSISRNGERNTNDLLKFLNEKHLEKFPGDSDLSARIATYELAGRMQMSIPEVSDLKSEPQSIIEEYGADSSNKTKNGYARNCILARRLLERGVRVVQLFNGANTPNGINNWDSHNNIKKTHQMQADIMDQPTATLIRDMKRRGMLDDVLVVWCTEFGRMPFLQGNGTGRDHNPSAFTCFMAGAGVKKGYSYGSSDEWGFKVAENPVEIYDFNATILHLLGLDHERLSYYHNGIEARLTAVHGHVIKDILA
ncbi:MAG: DUF1501 domain-containing protein [Lentisphaeraceae bacterium]|nr:DUF1501 domain-containing protein [Lentisphaeraceae bacterium]